MKMYEPPVFDTLIDFDIKDEEEIICRGRRRHTERRVPRLPHAAYIIKKQNEDRELMSGKRKRGRGRACILNPKTLNPEANEFRPRLPNCRLSNHIPRSLTVHLDMNENVYSSHSDGEIIGCSFQKKESVSHGDGQFHSKHHSADPLIPSSDEYTCDTTKIAAQFTKAQREKEKYNHKVNFAEINRQMLQELAGHIHNNVAFKKPVKVMSLTKANLDKHVRDTETVLKQSEKMYSSNIDTCNDNESPMYIKYGVTHEDIWLYKQNKFKMPQAVKNKENEFNKANQITDIVDGHVADKQNMETESHPKNIPNVESEHEKQVSYLKLLYDEDSWSNKKELSVTSADEEKIASDCQVSSVKNENDIESTDQEISLSVKCTDENDSRNKPVLGTTENLIAKMEITDSDVDEQANISEKIQDEEFHKQAVDAAFDCVQFDRLSFNGNTCSVSDPIESDERSLSIVDEIHSTMKQEETVLSEKQEIVKNNCEKNQVSTDNCTDILNLNKEEVQDKTVCRTSDIGETVDEVIDEMVEKTDFDLQNSKNIDSKGGIETILCSESTIFCDDHSEPLVTEHCEMLTQGKTKILETKVVRSTIDQLDDFSIPGDSDKETNIDKIVAGVEDETVENVDEESIGKVIKKKHGKKKSTSPPVEDESLENMDDMEGFQVVKKKRSKKKSLSPTVKQRRNKLKPDNTVWKLYGKNVIQVDGLPLDCDISGLCSVVSSFGTIMDYQERAIDTNCSIRFRLSDEDSCNYAVTCLDNTEILHDENCIVSCFKLSN